MSLDLIFKNYLNDEDGNMEVEKVVEEKVSLEMEVECDSDKKENLEAYNLVKNGIEMEEKAKNFCDLTEIEEIFGMGGCENEKAVVNEDILEDLQWFPGEELDSLEDFVGVEVEEEEKENVVPCYSLMLSPSPVDKEMITVKNTEDSKDLVKVEENGEVNELVKVEINGEEEEEEEDNVDDNQPEVGESFGEADDDNWFSSEELNNLKNLIVLEGDTIPCLEIMPILSMENEEVLKENDKGDEPNDKEMISLKKSKKGEKKNVKFGNNSSGLKTRECTVCGKWVVHWYLEKHMLIHTGEKPLKCKFCWEHFRFLAHLDHHIKRSHGKVFRRRGKSKNCVEPKLMLKPCSVLLKRCDDKTKKG